jgi:L-arabinose isomerase
VTTRKAVYQLCSEAKLARNWVGLSTGVQTISPAKVWIAGLRALEKPLFQLNTNPS